MSSIDIWTATPSRLGLPTYGRTSGIAASVELGTSVKKAGEMAFRCVDRVQTNGTDATTGAFPGTTAWRPPIC